jgi:CTP synthase
MVNAKKKFIVVCGGGSSEIGKTHISASLGYLLKENGIDIYPIKFDGYLNYSTGDMCEYHKKQKLKIFGEEVFILKDGTECDSDSGVYERFLGIDLDKDSYLTNGMLLYEIIGKDRGGGKILTFKSLKEEYKKILVSKKSDIILVEVGGTVGDIENKFFLETIAELSHDYEIFIILVAPLMDIHKSTDSISSSQTKLVRMSFSILSQMGIRPDVIICRGEDKKTNKKVLKFISEETISNILYIPFVNNIYEIPFKLLENRILDLIFNKFRIKKEIKKRYRLESFVRKMNKLKKSINLLVIDKMESYGSYVSIIDALKSAGVKEGIKVNIIWNTGRKNLKIHGMVLLNDYENIKKKYNLLKIARKDKIPTLGISGGFYFLVDEFVKNVLKEKPLSKHGNLKVGLYKTTLDKDLMMKEMFGGITIHERHRHTEYIDNYKILKDSLLKPVGFSKEKFLEIVKLNHHPFYVGVAFNPEYSSRPLYPHPLLVSFIRSIKRRYRL